MFAYRGFLLDSARHMQSVEEIKRLIDALAVLKYNYFHWHLTDDQGWRFESEVFPALNAAAVRPYSDFGKTREDAPYGRVYTRAELREVVEYCEEKGMTVVPEFDMPGHTSALLSVFPELSCGGEKVKIKTHQGVFKDVLCPAKEKTFETVTRLLDEFTEVFPGEYVHVGGDETPPAHWKTCPDCRRYMREHGIKSFDAYHTDFMNRIVDYLARKGRTAIVWNDAAKSGALDKRAVLQYWKERDKASVAFLNAGGRAILSPFSYYYLDYDFQITPLNRVYAAKPTLPGLTAEGRKNILGVEATLWTEFITEDRALEEHAFPRAIAVAQTGLGERRATYEALLRDVKELRKELDFVAFADEAQWTQPRRAMPRGWIRFAREHVSKAYLKELLS